MFYCSQLEWLFDYMDCEFKPAYELAILAITGSSWSLSVIVDQSRYLLRSGKQLTKLVHEQCDWITDCCNLTERHGN